jgi:hypothetical protein
VERIMTWGHWAEEGILDLASFVASSGSAGLVSLGIGGLFVGVLGSHAVNSFRIEYAVRRATALIKAAPDAVGFARDFKRIHEEFRFLGRAKGSSPRKSLWRGWRDFAESLTSAETQGRTGSVRALRNTVRPAYFFNSEDLGFERGIWRNWPGIFVSVGLFATFLGIIAALKNLIGGAEIAALNEETMGAFLDATKSKFIMSLSGLGASIAFNLWYRVRQSSVERQLAKLCDEIEDRVLFHTPEQIALDQLTTLQDMRKTLGLQVGDAVSESLSRDLDPILTKVNNSAGTQIEHLVSDLGEHLHRKLNASLDASAATLSGINEVMQEISSRMERSGANVAEEMSTGVNSLNDVLVRSRSALLEDRELLRAQRVDEQEAHKTALAEMTGALREQGRAGSQSLAQLVQELTLAARGLQESLRSAGSKVEQQVIDTVERMGREAEGQVMGAGTNVSRDISRATRVIMKDLSDLHSGLNGKLGAPVDDLVQKLGEANEALGRHASQMQEAAHIQESASQRLSVAAQRMQEAGWPLSQSSKAIQESLAASLQIIQASKQTAESSLGSMQQSMGRLQGLLHKADPLDLDTRQSVEDILRALVEGQTQIRATSDEVHAKIIEQLLEIRAAMAPAPVQIAQDRG